MKSSLLVKKFMDNKYTVILLFLSIIVLVFGISKFTKSSFALSNEESIGDTASDEVIYIIGEHLFTENTSYISSKMMMYAARTISVPAGVSGRDGLDYMNVYMRDLEGNWLDALSGEIVDFNSINVDIKYKDLERYYKTSASVSNALDMEIALLDEHITSINIVSDFETDKVFSISKDVTINGNGHKITLKNGSDSSNIFKIVDSNVSIRDLSFTGSDIAILVKGSNVSLRGNIDFSSNTSAGVKVIKGTGNPLLDMEYANVINNSEDILKPTVIEEGVSNCVKTKLRKVSDVSLGINHYYFKSSLKSEWSSVGNVITKDDVILSVGDSVDYKVDGYNGKWMVFGVSDNQILLMSEDNVESAISLDGKNENFAASSIDKLNNLCSKYGKGTYANKARSITIEDINKLTGYDPVLFNYGKGTDWEYGNSITYNIGDKVYTRTSNYYSYSSSEVTKIKKGDAIYNLIFGKDGKASYWVASSFVRTFNSYFNEGLRVVSDDEVHRSYLRFCDRQCTGETYSDGVKAVVYLDKDISLKKSDGNSVTIVK